MTSSLLSALLLCLALPQASADEGLRDRVLEHLSGYETPTTAADLRALGTGVDAELYAIAKDPSVARSRRSGAVYALGWFPNEEHHAWLTALCADGAADSHLRRSATWALANGWGDAALPALNALRGDPDDQLRNQAVRAVGHLGTPAAREALGGWLAAEHDAMVRATVQAQLDRQQEPR